MKNHPSLSQVYSGKKHPASSIGAWCWLQTTEKQDVNDQQQRLTRPGCHRISVNLSAINETHTLCAIMKHSIHTGRLEREYHINSIEWLIQQTNLTWNIEELFQRRFRSSSNKLCLDIGYTLYPKIAPFNPKHVVLHHQCQCCGFPVNFQTSPHTPFDSQQLGIGEHWVTNGHDYIS